VTTNERSADGTLAGEGDGGSRPKGSEGTARLRPGYMKGAVRRSANQTVAGLPPEVVGCQADNDGERPRAHAVFASCRVSGMSRPSTTNPETNFMGKGKD
jgi:hypothetical protein